jgi:hypothetical protein
MNVHLHNVKPLKSLVALHERYKKTVQVNTTDHVILYYTILAERNNLGALNRPRSVRHIGGTSSLQKSGVSSLLP